MSKFNRFLSSILAIVMIVTSLPVNTFAVGAGASSLGVYTDTTATTTSSGNGNTAGKKLYFAVSNENLTGYKLQLVFYPLSDKTYYEENNEDRRQAIIKEWDFARLSEYDKSIDKPLRLILKYGKIMEIKSKKWNVYSKQYLRCQVWNKECRLL